MTTLSIKVAFPSPEARYGEEESFYILLSFKKQQIGLAETEPHSEYYIGILLQHSLLASFYSTTRDQYCAPFPAKCSLTRINVDGSGGGLLTAHGQRGLLAKSCQFANKGADSGKTHPPSPNDN
jgi:hypothetical protein